MTAERDGIPNDLDDLATRIDAASDQDHCDTPVHLDECCSEHLKISQGASESVLGIGRIDAAVEVHIQKERDLLAALPSAALAQLNRHLSTLLLALEGAGDRTSVEA